MKKHILFLLCPLIIAFSTDCFAVGVSGGGANVYVDTYDIPSQAEAEAGVSETARVWSALRVKQSIDANASGVGDVIKGGQSGPFDIGTNDNTLFRLEQNNARMISFSDGSTTVHGNIATTGTLTAVAVQVGTLTGRFGGTVTVWTNIDNSLGTITTAGVISRFGGSSTFSHIVSDGAVTADRYYGDGSNLTGVSGSGDVLANGQAGPLTIGTNDNTQMSLEANDTILLELENGSMTVHATKSKFDGDMVVGSATSNVSYTMDVNGDCLIRGKANGGADGLFVGSTGNVGINDRTPSEGKLVIRGSTTSSSEIVVSVRDGNAVPMFSVGGDRVVYVGTPTSSATLDVYGNGSATTLTTNTLDCNKGGNDGTMTVSANLNATGYAFTTDKLYGDASGASGVVTGINLLTGLVTLAAGTDITLTPVGNTITIDSTASGGTGQFSQSGVNVYPTDYLSDRVIIGSNSPHLQSRSTFVGSSTFTNLAGTPTFHIQEGTSSASLGQAVAHLHFGTSTNNGTVTGHFHGDFTVAETHVLTAETVMQKDNGVYSKVVSGLAGSSTGQALLNPTMDGTVDMSTADVILGTIQGSGFSFAGTATIQSGSNADMNIDSQGIGKVRFNNVPAVNYITSGLTAWAPNNTDRNVIWNGTVTAGSLGPTGCFNLSFCGEVLSSANTKQIRVYLNPVTTGSDYIMTVNAVAHAGFTYDRTIWSEGINALVIHNSSSFADGVNTPNANAMISVTSFNSDTDDIPVIITCEQLTTSAANAFRIKNATIKTFYGD